MPKPLHDDSQWDWNSVVPMESSSPTTTSFTPINPEGLVTFHSHESSSNQPITAVRKPRDWHAPKVVMPLTARDVKSSKHPYPAPWDEDYVQTKRQKPLSDLPSSRPFQILKVTKALISPKQPLRSVAIKDVNFDRVDRSTTQTKESSYNLPLTTMEKMIPHSTEQLRDNRTLQGHLDTQIKSILDDNQSFDLPASSQTAFLGNSEGRNVQASCHGHQDIQSSEQSFDVGDAYHLDEMAEQAMSALLDDAENVYEKHIPPSSVIREGSELNSQFAADYDPTLQYSSPEPNQSSKCGLPGSEEDLLNDDVDWTSVIAVTNAILPDSSVVRSSQTVCRMASRDTPVAERTEDVSHFDGQQGLLKPFVRTSFPEKVRDRSSVPGASPKTLLRTCFRIGELINQTVRCCSHKQDAIFELFTCVTYSSREALSKKQYFQFTDLFKDRGLCPKGVLTDWKTGSQLDRQSSSFLDLPSGTKLCWCMCKAQKDPKHTIGWSYTILTIKETDWTEIEWSKRIVCDKIDKPT